MKALVSMCVALGILSGGCEADETGGDLGEGEACAWAALETTCEAAEAGLECSHDEGIIECLDGWWQEADCWVNPLIGCHEEGVVVVPEPCSAPWEGLTCPWAVADAGFSCSGTATCVDGSWVSNGVDQFDEQE